MRLAGDPGDAGSIPDCKANISTSPKSHVSVVGDRISV